MNKIHHIGIIVPDEERVDFLLQLFGIERGHSVYVEKYQANCIFAGLIEFIIPNEGSKLSQFNKGFGGLHHIAVETDDLQKTTEYLGKETITDADAERTKQYVTENKRKALEQSFTNLDAYLCSLEMTGKLSDINGGNIQRVVQLLGKTNQFNLTTRRHDETAIGNMLSLSGAFGLTLELSDKFGDHGLIAIAIGIPKDDNLYLDTFLMSCRVLNRTTENFLMNTVIDKAEENNFKKIIGEYIPTAKNGMVKDLYLKFGFEPLDDNFYVWHISGKRLETFISFNQR